MRKFKDYLTIGVKGACMGAADVIPGVSGGTIAFIMGIYDEFVGSIARIDKQAVKLLFKGHLREFWSHINGGFLLSIIVGIGVSVVALAGLMQMLLADYPIQTWSFFFGLIVASSIFILRARKVRNKMVVQGFMMKGQLKKDETVRLRIGGEVRSFKLLDVVPKRTEPFDRSQFFDELSANVHKHALKEGGEGWMILETEDCPELQKGTLLAGE